MVPLLQDKAVSEASARRPGSASGDPSEIIRWLPGLIVSALFVGCAPAVGPLKAHIRDGAFDKALKEVSGDVTMERELAALLVEDAAARGIGSLDLIEELSRAGKPGKRALKRLVKAEDDAVAELARIALQKHDLPDAPDLVRWIHHDHADVRTACAKAWHGTLEIHMLQRLVLDHSPAVRVYAVRGVGLRPRSDENAALLSEVLRLDPVPRVRAEAARFGPQLGEAALSLLKDLLSHPNLGLRLAAVQGLATLGTAEALAVVGDVVRRPMSEETVAAAAELARRGDKAGKDRLAAALADKRPEIRKAALLRLERAEVPRRGKILVGHLEDDAPDVVLLAAQLLRKNTKARGKVTKALQEISGSDHDLSRIARDTLAGLGNAQALSAVEESLLSDETPEVLASLNRVRGVDELRKTFVSLLADDREAVRIAAARALLPIAS